MTIHVRFYIHVNQWVTMELCKICLDFFLAFLQDNVNIL